MKHTYKQVSPPAAPTFSFVDLVTRWGDQWRLMVPAQAHCHKVGYEDESHDSYDAKLMTLMEQGAMARVE